MPQHPFPDPGHDGEEPDSSPLPPAAPGDGPDDEEDPPEQGLYVCLPAEQVPATGWNAVSRQQPIKIGAARLGP